jgi:uncharacterized protein YutE (UPF0331/DUF86 family)
VLVHGYISVDTLRISQILVGREYRKLANLALKILEAAGDT